MPDQRLEMGLLEEAIDWATHTGHGDEPVNVGQLKLEVDVLVEVELGAVPPSGAGEPRATPPATRARGSATRRDRLREDILRGAAFYDQHGQHNAAARAREIAAGLDTLND